VRAKQQLGGRARSLFILCREKKRKYMQRNCDASIEPRDFFSCHFHSYKKMTFNARGNDAKQLPATKSDTTRQQTRETKETFSE
jgi:hypothetical protein